MESIKNETTVGRTSGRGRRARWVDRSTVGDDAPPAPRADNVTTVRAACSTTFDSPRNRELRAVREKWDGSRRLTAAASAKSDPSFSHLLADVLSKTPLYTAQSINIKTPWSWTVGVSNAIGSAAETIRRPNVDYIMI